MFAYVAVVMAAVGCAGSLLLFLHNLLELLLHQHVCLERLVVVGHSLQDVLVDREQDRLRESIQSYHNQVMLVTKLHGC